MAKGKKSVFSVKTADMKRTNGLGSAQCAKNGIRLWKSRSLFQSLLLQEADEKMRKWWL